MIFILKKDPSLIQKSVSKIRDPAQITQPMPEVSSQVIQSTKVLSNEDLVKQLYFKINFLNACGTISDIDYDFLTNSLPKFTPKSALTTNSQQIAESERLNPIQKMKLTINKSIADLIDVQTSSQITSSPFFSLTLQLDPESLAVFVYIQFVDHTSISNSNESADVKNLQCRSLIRILNFKQFNQTSSSSSQSLSTQPNLIPAKLSKYLIEQIRNNVINQFHLSNKNLMCIALDTRILERLCFPTFQFYLNEFIHDCILVIPNYSVAKPIQTMLASYEENCLTNFFKTTNTLIDYFRHVSSLMNSKPEENLFNLNETGNLADLNECFKDKYLPETNLVLQSVYLNYSLILERLDKEHRLDVPEFNLDTLFEMVNTIDYYFITCLLHDATNFLFDYMLFPKRFCASHQELKMPWHIKGSVLNNLLNEQIGLNSNESNSLLAADGGNDNLGTNLNSSLNENTQQTPTLTSTVDLNIAVDDKKSTIEFEKPQLERLTKLKDFVETNLINCLDFCSERSINREKYAYLTKSKPDDDETDNEESSISMLEIYSSLSQMFDVAYSNVSRTTTNTDLKTNKYKVNMTLSTAQLQNILCYYKFNLYTDLNQFQNEYHRFFEKFFKIYYASVDFKDEEIAHASLYERTLMSNNEIKMNFIKFVHENNNTKFCPIVSTLASIYSILPSIIDFKELKSISNLAGESNMCISAKGTNITAQDIAIIENKSKLLDLYSSHANCSKEFSIKFEDL
jgi:hypothetical protein